MTLHPDAKYEQCYRLVYDFSLRSKTVSEMRLSIHQRWISGNWTLSSWRRLKDVFLYPIRTFDDGKLLNRYLEFTIFMNDSAIFWIKRIPRFLNGIGPITRDLIELLIKAF